MGTMGSVSRKQGWTRLGLVSWLRRFPKCSGCFTTGIAASQTEHSIVGRRIVGRQLPRRECRLRQRTKARCERLLH